MAKVQFSTTVKYKDVMIPAFTPFEVDDSDFELVVSNGGHVLEHPKKYTVEDNTNDKTESKSTEDNTTTRRRRR